MCSGRDPRLRQQPDHHQFTQMPCVRAIVLGPLLAPPPRGGLRRLGQAHHGARPAQLLDHEPPTRRRLQRDLELLAPNRLKNSRTPARCAGATRARDTSPVDVSIQSAVICARC
jgi:hypothetical protein